MKTMLLGAAAVAALATPAIANAETRGSIDLGYEHNDFSYNSSTFQGYSLGATIIHDLSNGLTVQGDGRTTWQTWDGYDQDYNQNYAAAHLSTSANGWDFGAFAGVVGYYDNSGYMIGGETRTAFGDFSVDGSIAYSHFNDSTDFSAMHYRLGGAYFFMPNFAVTAGASWTHIDYSPDYDLTELSIGGAYQFANNVTLSGGYTHTDGDRSNDTSYDGDTFMLGVSFNFNGGTLQENTNHGAWTSARHVSDTWMRW